MLAYTNESAWDFITGHYGYIQQCIEVNLVKNYEKLADVGHDELLSHCIEKLHYNLTHRGDKVKTVKGFISFRINKDLLNYATRKYNPDKKMLKMLNDAVLNI